MEVAALGTTLGLVLLTAVVAGLIRRRGPTGTEARRRLRVLQNQHSRRPGLAESAETSAKPQMAGASVACQALVDSHSDGFGEEFSGRDGATRSATRTPCLAVCHAENEGFRWVLTG